MIKEWLLSKLLNGKIVLFEKNNEFFLINDICFEDDHVVVCKSRYNFVEYPEYEFKELGV